MKPSLMVKTAAVYFGKPNTLCQPTSMVKWGCLIQEFFARNTPNCVNRAAHCDSVSWESQGRSYSGAGASRVARSKVCGLFSHPFLGSAHFQSPGRCRALVASSGEGNTRTSRQP